VVILMFLAVMVMEAQDETLLLLLSVAEGEIVFGVVVAEVQLILMVLLLVRLEAQILVQEAVVRPLLILQQGRLVVLVVLV
jgi:hypothetical protein